MEQQKPFWQSKTLWGVVLMLLAHFFPKLLIITGDSAAQDAVIQQFIEVIGTILAIWGRLTAEKGLVVKK